MYFFYIPSNLDLSIAFATMTRVFPTRLRCLRPDIC